MAKIKPRERTGELFPRSSLVAVSDDLHTHIIRAIETQIGAGLKKITKGIIVRIMSAPSFRNTFFTAAKSRTIFLDVTIVGIRFPSPHTCCVSARLLFPLYGNPEEMKTLLRHLVKRVGLRSVSCTEYGMGVKVNLSGEAMPCQIIPSPLSNGNGQKVFATRKEILSGCSPIS